MKKIVFLMNEINYGGTLTQIINLVNSLSDLYKIEIICMNKCVDCAFDKKIIINNVEVKTSIIDYLSNKRLVKEVSSYVDSADVIVVNDLFFNKLIDKINTNNKLVFYWMHSIIDDVSDLTKYDKVIIPNEFIYNELKLSNSVYIPNAIEKSDVLTDYSERNKIVFVGKLSKGKCLDVLVEVMEKLVGEVTDVLLNIIGDGSERSNLITLIKDKGLDKNINLLGSYNRCELIDELKDSTVFVSTSENEMFNLAVLEAMNVGLPVVAFETRNLDTLINDDIDGVLIKNRDVNQMVKEIKLLLDNEQKCIELGGCAVEKSMNFDINVLKRDWIKIFK